MCEMFSSHFSSVYSSTAINLDDLVGNGLPHELPSTCLVSLDDVMIRLKKLRNIKSVGPDGLPGYFLYSIRASLCYPLFLVISKSLCEGLFPDIWKISSVTPIFKSGDTIEVSNYRLISIISHLAKLMESIVLSSI